MPARSLLRRCSVSALAIATMMLFGCESSDVDLSSNWNNSSSSDSTQTSGDTQTSTDSSSDATAGSTAGDQESFSSFNFCYGGFDGSAAVQSGVQISSLSFASDGLTFRYVTDLSAWGLSYDDASGALACLFVKRSDGTWVGGKFDWISSSRTHRGFSGHVPGYNGWTLSGVPNPCEACFVIVSADGRRRSNVLKGTWTR